MSAPPVKPLIILVRPQKGENIGAAARVMRNFGLDALRLVKPAVTATCAPARAMAAGALNVLTQAQTFATLAESIADCRFTLAITARRRDMEVEALTTQQAARPPASPAAFVFGPERTGLANEEVALADALLHLPTAPDFSSLNLAQAVAVVAWNWFSHTGAEAPPAGLPYDPAPKKELQGLFDHLETALTRAGFFRPPEKKPAMILTLRAALQKARLSEREIRALRGVVAALEKSR